MKTSRYVGPVPVSLPAYSDMINQQLRSRPIVSQHALEKAMTGLVLSDAAKQTLGLVASSGRSLFLSGPAGNGKTAIAHALVNAIAGHVWIPYAVEIDNQVIQLFDHHSHQTIEMEGDNYDQRWVKIHPPLIIVGGELAIENLDLVAGQENGGFYEAPVQMKANGGVLVVDDLGRQRCSASELLNRWIIPLEMKHDYLALSTGKKIRVPFATTVVFATNLTVSDVADEAFLRRMGYRLLVMPPSPDTYAEIFMRYARAKGLPAAATLLAHLEQRYARENRIPKACEPRDLIDRAIEACKYRREAITISVDSLDVAWNCYFGTSASG
jgi:predicted ATPase with chaperone activity